MKPILSIRDLQLELGAFRLGPISLALDQGDYLVLLGPSGCGKTSLLRALAGIHDTPSGALLLEDEPIGTLAPHRRRIGYVAQTADLFPHLNVAANVAFGLRYRQAGFTGATQASTPVNTPAEAFPKGCGTPEKRGAFTRITRLLGLADLLHREPATLSGGESRRVALARSLIVNPRVLLLDEPLSMLDHNARAEMLAVLKTIHSELGTATIHVTHDREEAWTLGGHCAVMREGLLEQTGPVETLFRRPATRFVAEFLGGANVHPARFECDGGTAWAVCDWARFRLDKPVPYQTGYIQIRPETLGPAGPDTPERITGTIASASDRGIYTELEVAVYNGPRLRVHWTGADTAAWHPGRTVALACRTPPFAMER